MTKSISTLSIFPPVSGATIALLRLPFGQQALPGPGNMGALTTLSRLREVVEQDIVLLIPLCFYTHRVAHTHTHRHTHTHTHEQAVGKQPQTCFCCHVCQGVSATCARLSATKIFQQLHNNTISHQEILSHFSQHQSMSITMFRGECIFLKNHPFSTAKQCYWMSTILRLPIPTTQQPWWGRNYDPFAECDPGSKERDGPSSNVWDNFGVGVLRSC